MAVKLKKLVEEYKLLKETNEKLKVEKNFFEREMNNYKKSLAQNSNFENKRKKAVFKIEQILKKIDSLKVL